MTPTQQTLTGEPTDESRQRPNTLVECPECETVLLRSERHDHPHDVFPWTGFNPAPAPADPDADLPDDEPEHIGDWYEIELSYSADYTFRVPGYSQSDAERVAKAMALEQRPHDRYHVHTSRRKLKPIHSDDAETVEKLEELERGV